MLVYAEPNRFSGLEMVLLALLIAISLAAFWSRFGQILKRITTAKKDANFHLTHLGKRSWDFFWQVLCQAKVIQQRPLPGLAYCLRILGLLRFCAGLAQSFASEFTHGFFRQKASSDASTIHVRGDLCSVGGDFHHRAFHPQIFRQAQMARVEGLI